MNSAAHQTTPSHMQTERVARAFDASSWTSLKQLEHEKYVMEQVMKSLDESDEPVTADDLDLLRRRASVGGGSLSSFSRRFSVDSRGSELRQPLNGSELRKHETFSQFSYVEDPLDDKLRTKRDKERQHKEKILEIGRGSDWKPVRNLNLKQYEIYPHLIDPFEAMDNEQVRIRAINRAKKLAGDFKPAGRNKPSVTRASFDDILEELYFKLEADWKDEIGVPTIWVEKDLILIFFRDIPASMRRGLTTYMNMMTNGEIVAKYRLTRVIKRWNKEVKGQILFTFRPPWVSMNEIYLSDDVIPPSTDGIHRTQTDTLSDEMPKRKSRSKSRRGG